MQLGKTVFVGPETAKCLMLPVKSAILVSDSVQAYSSKIILYFQLQNHQYLYSGVSLLSFGFPAPVQIQISLFIYTYTKFSIYQQYISC